ncbi:MAG TPA: YceI family protein [Gemmatimonadaceae bacterium]|nr:YceI family protein [Gemmatimonadaceae bacterium]
MLWSVDPQHAVVEFSVKHMAISTVKGQFKSFTATGETNDAGVPTSLRMEIDAASITTNNEQRDAHLNSGDFFDVAAHPTITFVSTSIKGDVGDLKITGDLTMRGVTKPVTLTGELSQTVTDPWGNKRTSIVASGKLSREAWGLTWNQALEFGGFMVSDDVKLHIEAEAVATSEAAVA